MLISFFDPSALSQTKGNIFVKNLPPSMNNKGLYNLFKPCGEIFSIKVAQEMNGQSKCYGFIQFKDAASSIKAIETLNNTTVEGKSLQVQPYKPNERKGQAGYTNLFVKNLPKEINTKEELDRLFEKFGTRTSVGIYQKELKGVIGYYGFVNFSKNEEAQAAITEMNGKTINGMVLYVAKALNKDQREREKIKNRMELRNRSRKFTLYIRSNTQEPLSEAMINGELGLFGEIKSITIQKQRTSEGTEVNGVIGYAVYAREEDAAKVIKDC